MFVYFIVVWLIYLKNKSIKYIKMGYIMTFPKFYSMKCQQTKKQTLIASKQRY